MRKFFFLNISVIFIFLSFSCSSFNSTTRYEQEEEQEEIQSDTVGVVQVSIIVNEMLEEARQDYLNALKNKKLGFKIEALESFENALKGINKLSYFPGIEQNESFTELETSIFEDYKNYVEGLDEIPENTSITALDEWMSKNIPELPPLEEDEFEDSEELDSLATDVIVVGDFPLEVNRYVEEYIEYFTGRGRIHLETWLKRSGRYFKMMAKVFA